MQGMEAKGIGAKLDRLPVNFPAVSLVYLFGSQMEGRTGPLSDYDVGVLLERRLDTPDLRARLTHEVAVLLNTPQVDVVWLAQAPVELAFAVISQGKVIYQRDLATRVEYEALVMSRYGDYLPVLRAQRREILMGGKRAARVQWYREAFGRTERTLGQIRAAQGKAQG